MFEISILLKQVKVSEEFRNPEAKLLLNIARYFCRQVHAMHIVEMLAFFVRISNFIKFEK